MKKYAISAIAAVLAAAMLTACGGGKTETTDISASEITVSSVTQATSETTATETPQGTTVTTAKSKLTDIIGNKNIYTPDMEVNVSRVDVPRAQYIELINDIKYCDDMYSFITCNYTTDFYYDYYILETIYESEVEYYKVDECVATNFEEMFSCARKCFSDNFISDDELYELMFGSQSPSFKMIDGQLANLKVSPRWERSPHLDYDNAGVVAYSETRATVWVAEGNALEAGYLDTNIFNMVRDSENDMWKIDSFKYLRRDAEE